MACTGQTLTHGGFSHCMQGLGVKRARTRGNSPSTSGMTVIQSMRRPAWASAELTTGTLFSALQATTQAWQPVHRSRSITIPQRAIYTSLTNDQLNDQFPMTKSQLLLARHAHPSRITTARSASAIGHWFIGH